MEKPSNKKIEIKKLAIKMEHVKRLSPTQRHLYYLLGHMANEFQTIQMLLIAARPSEHDERLFRIQAEMSQVWFFIRIAIGKIYEATESINRLSKNLRDEILTDIETQQEWKKLVKQTNKTQWLGKIRNKLSFHFPTDAEWLAGVEPESSTWTDDEIHMTEDSARTFYQGSDHLLLFAVLQQIDEKPAAETIGKLLDNTTQWVKDFCDLLNQIMADFIAKKFPDLTDSEPTSAGNVLASHINTIRLPFWYYNEMNPLLE